MSAIEVLYHGITGGWRSVCILSKQPRADGVQVDAEIRDWFRLPLLKTMLDWLCNKILKAPRLFLAFLYASWSHSWGFSVSTPLHPTGGKAALGGYTSPFEATFKNKSRWVPRCSNLALSYYQSPSSNVDMCNLVGNHILDSYFLNLIHCTVLYDNNRTEEGTRSRSK